MNVVIMGLGSMGRRRIRLTRQLHPGWGVVGVDVAEARRAQAAVELGVAVYADLTAARRACELDAALVCTSPLSHGAIVLECLQAGLHVFTELNLVSDWYERALALAAQTGRRLFVSSSFLYRRETNYVAESVGKSRVNYIYHSGQYLPDWHPWESYKSFFVADRRTNACREILAIELPWLIRAFGEIEAVHVMADRNSTLDVDFNDNYMISLRHRGGSKGIFCPDVISRKGLRRLEVYSEGLHLFWDGTPQSLTRWNISERRMEPVSLYEDVEQDARYNANIIENMYADELEAFYGYLLGTDVPAYGLRDDLAVLRLVDQIEEGLNGSR